MANLVYGINIKADGSGQVAAEVKKTEQAFAGLEAKVNQTSTSFRSFDSAINENSKNISNSIGINANALSSIKNLAAGYLSFSGAIKAANLADNYKKLTAQLQSATSSQAEFFTAMKNVEQIAKSAQANINAIGSTYSRLSLSLKDFGVNQTQVATITETLSLALKVNGATAEETGSAMLQLSQAFSKGKLDGDEFKSAMEVAPNLMLELAKSMGVTKAALYDLSEQGKLTTDVLINGFSNPEFLNSLRNQADQMRTIKGAFQELENSLVLAVGTFDKATGASDLLAAALGGVSSSLDTLIKLANNEPINWGKFIPGAGKSIQVQEDGTVLVDTLSNIAKQAQLTNKYLGKIGEIPPNIDLGNINDATDGFKKINEQINSFLNNQDFDSKGDRFRKQIVGLNKAFLQATKGVVEGSPLYIDALKKFESKRDEILEAFASKEKKRKIEDPLKSARENLKQLELENKLIAQGASLDEAQTIAKLRLTGATDAFIVATLNANQAQKAYIDKQKTAEDQEKTLAKNREDALQSIDQITEKTYAESAAFKEKYDLLTRGVEVTRENELAILDQTIANTEWAKSQAQSLGYTKENIDFIDTQISAYKRLREAKADALTNETALKSAQATKKAADDAIKENERALKESAKEAAKAADDINKSLTDALLRGFESGKGFAKNFRDTLTNMFKTLVLRPAISFLIDSSGITKALAGIGSAFSGNGLAGQAATEITGNSGFGGLLSQGKTLFEGITQGFGNLNNSFIESIAGLGTTLRGFGLDGLGTLIENNSTMLGNIAPYAGAALSLLKGDVKGAFFQGAGAAIGNYFGGPVGGAIGSFVGKIVGGLFGKKKAPRFDSNVTGTFLTDDKAYSTAQGFTQYKRLGADAQLGDLGKAFSKTLDTMLSEFGLGADITTSNRLQQKRKKSIGDFTAVFDGITVSANTSGKAKNTQDTFNRLVDTVLSTTIIQAIQSSKLTDGIKSLFDDLTDKTQVANMINASLALNSAQDALINQFGLTVDAAAKVSASQEDVLAMVNNLAASALSARSVGQALIDTRDALVEATKLDILPATLSGFDNILKGIDTSTQAGAERFAEVFNQRASVASLINATDSIKNGVRSSLFDIVSGDRKRQMATDVLNSLFGALNLAVPESLDAFIKMADTIDYSTKAGLDLAAAFPNLVNAFEQVEDSSNSVAESLSKSADSFKSLVDFNRYRGIANAYGSGYAKTVLNIPSFDVGTNSVPADMLAFVHANERIVPAADNQAMINALKNEGMQLLLQEVAKLRADNRTGIEESIKQLLALATKLDKWDKRGLPQFDPESDKGAVIDVKVAA